MRKTILTLGFLFLFFTSSVSVYATAYEADTSYQYEHDIDNEDLELGIFPRTVIYPDGISKYYDNTKNIVFIMVNGTLLSESGFIENNRTMVPIRVISEKLGAKVNWDGEQKKVSISANSKTIEMWIDNLQVNIDGKKSTLDVKPKIYQNTTYVPLRFVSESL